MCINGLLIKDGARTNQTIRMPNVFRCVLLPSSPCVAESRPQREGLSIEVKEWERT